MLIAVQIKYVMTRFTFANVIQIALQVWQRNAIFLSLKSKQNYA